MIEYLNRELSWIDFNARVLEEGLRKDLPPLERFRFLAIVSSNFDEFFMVRVAALKRAIRTGNYQDSSGIGGRELFHLAAEKTRDMFHKLYHCLRDEVLPALNRGGLEFRRPPYSVEETVFLKGYFQREIFPVLTPLRFSDPPPLTGNGLLYAAFLLKPAEGSPGNGTGVSISIVQVPQALDRIVWIPVNKHDTAMGTEKLRWTLLDDIIMNFGSSLFPGYEVEEKVLFRVQRDADFSVDERRDEDFIEAMEEVLVSRDYSQPVRLVYSTYGFESSSNPPLVLDLARRLGMETEDIYRVDGHINLGALWNLSEIKGFEAFKEVPHKQYLHPAFSPETPVFDSIRSGDILLTLPYHSFDPVIRFFEEAAMDPLVISIKTTLYRTSGNSPIVRALEQAAVNGKHVTVVVELKARFDEERNILWAGRLERAGVIVIYGLSQLKVHAKITQVIRREPGGMARYIHLSTGNYNDKTARFYSDLSFFTAREEMGGDATFFFNMLTGYSAQRPLRQLVMAPILLKKKLLELIDREAKRSSEGAPGKIMAKMNALLDSDIINALYKASRARVKILLNIRGICTLVPGVPGLSENITVISIVDHYLEHSRILYFANGGAEEWYISSADWMPRNLERRVELLIPILDEGVREEIRDILGAYFRDNTQAWVLASSGTWTRRVPAGGESPFKAQEYLRSLAAQGAAKPWKAKEEFTVRRAPPEI